jgi:hypothetical protein
MPEKIGIILTFIKLPLALSISSVLPKGSVRNVLRKNIQCFYCRVNLEALFRDWQLRDKSYPVLIISRPHIFSVTSRSNLTQDPIFLQHIPTSRDLCIPLQHWCDFHPVCRYGWPVSCRYKAELQSYTLIQSQTQSSAVIVNWRSYRLDDI